MPQFHRFKILLDEGLPPRKKLPRLNERHDVKHSRDDYKLGGLSDEKVYEQAIKTKRILVIYNVKDYRGLAEKTKHSGIIGISQNLPIEQIDKKLTALLAKSKRGDLYGRYFYISGETDN
jgi:hypothetical protein